MFNSGCRFGNPNFRNERLDIMKSEKDCIEYIHSLSRFGEKSGLDNITKICAALGDPQDRLNFIHVAGTNGKGSVCAMIASVLSHRYRTGLYISPFIEMFNERISINGENISAPDLVKYTAAVRAACESADVHPIEFEFITAMGFLYFADKGCDLVVLETGLGGRLDSTNIIKNPLAAVITAVGYDHTAILGDTIEKIAFEKGGIIKSGSPTVIYGDMDSAARGVIADICLRRGSDLHECAAVTDIETSLGGTSFTLGGRRLHTSLCGAHQAYNAALAVAALDSISGKLPVDDHDIADGLMSTEWKCRFEVMRNGDRTIILDGAHNAHGMGAFCAAAESILGDVPKTVVLGMLGEKDFAESVRCLCKLSNIGFIVTSVPSLRSADCDGLVTELRSNGARVRCEEDCFAAVRAAADSAPRSGVVCVVGSLYLVGAVREQCMKLMNS